MTAKENKAAGNPAESETPDPFDLDALRAQPVEGSLVTRELSTVPVRRPKKNEFFRVHPDPDYVVDAYTFVHEVGMDKETYWVTAGLRTELLEHLQPTRLFTCVNRADVTFLWPAKLPDAGGGGGRSWSVSALEAAERAKTSWLRIHGNKDTGAYDRFVARAELPEPKFADKTFGELVRIAFKDRIIDSIDHSLVKEIYGLI